MAKNYTTSFGTGDPRGFTGLAPTFIQFWNLSTGTTNAPPSIAETVVGKTGIYTWTYGVTQPIQFLLDAATTIAGRYVVGQMDPADRIDEVGTSLIALGTTSIAIGTTQIGQGVTMIALGTTSVAIGTTHIGQGVSLLAQGVSLSAQSVTLTSIGFSGLVYGSSLFALGTTGVALGTTAIFDLVNIGSTLTGVGNSLLALGSLIGSTSSSFGSTSADPVDVLGFLKRAQEINEGNQIYTKATGLLDFYNRGSSTLLREKTISDTSLSTTKT